MPPVPKRRTPRSRRDRRRSNSFPAPDMPNLLECDECGELVRPYHVCASCGHYRGRKVLDVEGD